MVEAVFYWDTCRRLGKSHGCWSQEMFGRRITENAEKFVPIFRRGITTSLCYGGIDSCYSDGFGLLDRTEGFGSGDSDVSEGVEAVELTKAVSWRFVVRGLLCLFEVSWECNGIQWRRLGCLKWEGSDGGKAEQLWSEVALRNYFTVFKMNRESTELFIRKNHAI